MIRSPMVRVKVWGAYGLFTRPETKSSPVSYPVMTPTAAKGILESIFWHPQFQWKIRSIEILHHPRSILICRNELKRGASLRTMDRPLVITDKSVRTQRHALILCDPAYIINADVIIDEEKADRDDSRRVEKWIAQFNRRVQRGRCYSRPYLGCREFSAHFCPPSPDDRPVAWTADLGVMPHSIDYSRDDGSILTRVFRARVEDGVMKVSDQPIGGGYTCFCTD